MRAPRIKVKGRDAAYHCMTRTVNGQHLFKNRDKEVLRGMIHKVADFSGVEVLTFCVLSNHFHVLVRVRNGLKVSDDELMRRHKLLYPKPTQYQTATAEQMAALLKKGGEEAEDIRRTLLARMADVSEFMKTLKQRFSVWYNRTHERYGTLWAERFKSVLVEGQGNPLQTMAAYIDLNPVRAGLVSDPKEYRFCGYCEAAAGVAEAQAGLLAIWSDRGANEISSALQMHRALIFGKHASEPGLSERSHAQALKVLEADGELPKAELLRCRVRYFTDGAILGSAEFVHELALNLKIQRNRKRPPKAHAMRGGDWGGLSVMRGLRGLVFR